MLKSPPKEKEWVSWLAVVLWTLLIFLTIPFARTMRNFVRDIWGMQAFEYLVIFIIVAAAAVAIAYLMRLRVYSPGNYLWLFITSCLFVGSTIRLRDNPEEAIHFVEYGVLGLLLYRALTHRIRDGSIYFAAAIIGAIIGTADEAIQWVVPRRYWGLRDIGLNVFGVSLILVAIAKGLKPAIIADGLVPFSIKRVCRLAVVALLLLAGSLLNTPARIAWYSERLPFLQFLKTNDSVMAEYGYLYEDPEIGRFRSRLSPEALKTSDVERAAKAANILDRYRPDSLYSAFLGQYTPVNDPFLHEARVHLFRRDRYLRKAADLKHDEEQYKYRLTVAFRENQIMQKYFQNTLYHSDYVLQPEQIAIMKQNLLPNYSYESAVSKRLFTSINEQQVKMASLVALLALFVINRYFARQGKMENAARSEKDFSVKQTV